MSISTTIRPWGSYTVLVDEPDHKVKRILVKAGHRISLQYHRRREEHWTIVSGNARIVNGKMGNSLHQFIRGTGTSIKIPANTIHRIEALEEDVVFIEVQLGSYFGEDDIVRLEDDFGRTTV